MADYGFAEQIQSLDEPAEFNKKLCEGVIATKAQQYETALNLFSKAITMFPQSKEGYIYRFLTYISTYLNTNSTSRYNTIHYEIIAITRFLSGLRTS